MFFKNENAVVAAIGKAIKELYPKAYILKIHGGQYQESGIPDLLVTVDGLEVGIEVKHQKPGESYNHALDRTTLKQRIHIKRIIEAGGMAGVAMDVEPALYLIQLAKLKQKMMRRGAPIEDYPLPPDWDYLMRVDDDKIIEYQELQVIPHP
jgi:hypothetical protein